LNSISLRGVSGSRRETKRPLIIVRRAGFEGKGLLVSVGRGLIWAGSLFENGTRTKVTSSTRGYTSSQGGCLFGEERPGRGVKKLEGLLEDFVV